MVKLGLVIGAAGAASATGALLISPFLEPAPTIGRKEKSESFEQIRYTRFPTSQWWDDRVGEPIRVTDFGVWQGATGVWRGEFSKGSYVPGSGYPVLVIRVIREDTYFQAPDQTQYPIPPGHSLYYDDPARDLRIVVLFDRCTHLCCFPSWHLSGDYPPTPRDYAAYGASPPTWVVYGQDPVCCVCHYSQYDPLLLSADVNPKNGVPFVGARIVHGPGTFNLPVIPVRAIDDVLHGGMADPRWYEYC